ncbi:MAG: ABC transporter permease [Sulfurovum sp.]|nr:ABC transporter permease [Sulfurovum sp.]
MTNSIKIAFRNTLRNKRRTLLSVLAIAIGGVASLLLGAFVSSIYYGIQTGISKDSGHLHIHKNGFFKYGIAKVGQYDMANYLDIIQEIKNSDTKDEISVVTPTLSIAGIVSNSYRGTSQTFMGIGLVADDQKKMQEWDGFGLNLKIQDIPFDVINDKKGLMGKGLAINLGMCEELGLDGCLKSEKNSTQEVDPEISSFAIDISSLDKSVVDIMVAPAQGAPNISSLAIAKVWQSRQKTVDDRFIAMPLEVAQSLFYGSDYKKVNTVTVQLKDVQKTGQIKQNLQKLFEIKGWNLEIITLSEFAPQFKKVLSMFGFIFIFVSLIIAVIVLFTVSNTMTMSVMERYKEIGTLRSMGLRRWGVKKYFIIEGAIIGVFGATLGVTIAYIIATTINNSGLTWSPPSGSDEQLLILQLTQNPMLIITVWVLLVTASVISSFLPAKKASNMPIIDALRYN